MSFPMYRPAFMPGPAPTDNRLPSLLAQSLNLPTRPLLPSSQMMSSSGIHRFMPAPAAAPMLVLPPAGMVPPQPHPPQNILFNQPSSSMPGASTNNLGSSLPSLPKDVQNFLNQVSSSYQGVNYGVPPPTMGAPAGLANPSMGQIHHQLPPPHFMGPADKNLPQGAESHDQEVDPDQPLVDSQRISLDFFNSDLHLEISKSGYEAKNITDPPGFCFCWAGVRATHGVSSGKVFYEVRIVENLKVDFGDDHTETEPHLLRIGWSMNHASLQLGEEMDSWGYGGTGRFSTNNKFNPYGEPYALGDVIAAYLDLESKPPTMSFAKNGRWMGMASPLYGYKVGCSDRALFPHVLSKNCRFEVNFGQQQPWCPQHLSMGHMFVDYYPARVRGSVPPKKKSDCEIIMIVGLPGAGKTSWGLRMSKENPDKRYNIIGTDTLIDKMKVMGLSRKNNYHGRWEVLIQKATSCLNKLFLIAGRRRRNYILDQTNVYASARKRKMKYFTGFKRVCAVVQPEDDELKRREWKRTFEDGKMVPEDAVLEMKFNYSLPDVRDDYVDEVVWIELNQSDACDVVRMYGEEAKVKLPSRKRPVVAENDQACGDNNKLMKIWDHQLVGMDCVTSSQHGLPQTSDPTCPDSANKFGYSDFHHHHQHLGFNQGGNGFQQASPQQEPSGQPQRFQSLPLVGVPPPGPQNLSTQDSGHSYEGWDKRLRMPGIQGLLQTPSSGATNPSNPNNFPDLSQPPPMFPVQRDVTQPPPNLSRQFQAEEKMQAEHMQASWMTQNLSPNTGATQRHPGDIDNRIESHPRDERTSDGNDGDRRDIVPLLDLPHRDKYDYHHDNMPGDDRYDREREDHFGERREDWRQQDRGMRREPYDNYHQGRERDDEDRWRGRGGRLSRRSPIRDSYTPRGHGSRDGDRGSREGSRDNRRWNDGRDERGRSRDRGSFHDRPPHRSRWEDDKPPSSGPNRQPRSLLGDSPQPLISADMMDKWKDVSRPMRSEGNLSAGEPMGQQQRAPPPPNPRFAGPRVNQPPPPPLRGPRPMPPRVPPPAIGFRGPAQNWP